MRIVTQDTIDKRKNTILQKRMNKSLKKSENALKSELLYSNEMLSNISLFDQSFDPTMDSKYISPIKTRSRTMSKLISTPSKKISVHNFN